jgi:hypothetical protein
MRMTVVVATLGLMLAGCGSSSGGAGTSNGSPGGSSVASLEGTWDFTGTDETLMSAGTITVDTSSITITANGGMWSLTKQGGTLAVSYSDERGDESATGTQTASGAVSFGAFPFDASGSTMITEVPADPDKEAGTCQGTLTASAITAGCTSVGRPPKPAPRMNGTFSATKISSADSIFGDIGGMWTGTNGSNQSCSITLQGAGLSTDCTGTGLLKGMLTMAFTDTIASGTTTAGVEFSATRR